MASDFVLLAMCLCFVWAHDLSCLCYIMCSHVYCLDPTPLVTWLLVNLPHLCFPRYLLICSLFNRLVFAILCEFVVECCVCALCPAQPVCFPLQGSFCLFLFIFILLIKALFCLHLSPQSPSLHLHLTALELKLLWQCVQNNGSKLWKYLFIFTYINKKKENKLLIYFFLELAKTEVLASRNSYLYCLLIHHLPFDDTIIVG